MNRVRTLLGQLHACDNECCDTLMRRKPGGLGYAARELLKALGKTAKLMGIGACLYCVSIIPLVGWLAAAVVKFLLFRKLFHGRWELPLLIVVCMQLAHVRPAASTTLSLWCVLFF